MNNKKMLYMAIVLGVIVVIGVAVLYAFPIKPEHTVKPIKAVSLFIDDIDDNIPLYGNLHDIIYYSNNGTWILQEKEEYNQKFDKKYYISTGKYELYSYSPDVAINGSSISLDFGIRNMMGMDIQEVPLTIETRISQKEREMVPAAQRTIILNDLKEGEYREIRVIAELAKPSENETLHEAVILTTPLEIKALNGSTVRQNTLLPASGSASFYIKPAYKPDKEDIQPTPVSQGQAKEIAESRINEVKAQTQFVEWEELWANPNATIGMPYLVRTVDEKPLYWTVPVILDGKVIGFIEVKMNGKVPRYGGMGCLNSPYYNPKNIGNCSSIITLSTSEEAKDVAKNITDKYKDAVVSEPIFVYDDTGCCSGEAWMLKVAGKDGIIISRVFVSGYYAYERKEEEIS